MELARLVDRSVASAVAGEGRVAVAFSGGVDSSILARCAAKRGEVVACTAFSEGAGDESRAPEAAAALGLDFAPVKLTKENVGEALRAIDLPFVPTLMDRSLWCLYSIVARSAQGAGAKVMLLGQLADELFGGYAKYAEALRSRGSDAAASMMSLDVREYERHGRTRDVGACGLWVRPRLPFGAKDVTYMSQSLPVAG